VLASDRASLELFLEQARLAARLTHPNVVQTYELGRDHGTYYLAMEYVPGCDLEHLLAASSKPLGLAAALYVTAAVLEGLEHAHERRDLRGRPLALVHHDLGPRKVLVSVEGDVKLAGFVGRATRRASPGGCTIEPDPPGWVSPERARGERGDRRADIFACGALLYRMVTGFDPYADAGPRLAGAVRPGALTHPAALVPGLPSSVVGLIGRAMAPDQRQRPATARQMRREALAAARGLGLRADRDDLADLVAARLPDLLPRVAELVAATSWGEPAPAGRPSRPSTAAQWIDEFVGGGHGPGSSARHARAEPRSGGWRSDDVPTLERALGRGRR
jgi:serine/threonine-protein kinase